MVPGAHLLMPSLLSPLSAKMSPSLVTKRPIVWPMPLERFRGWVILFTGHVKIIPRAGMVANTVLLVSTKMASGDALLELVNVTAAAFHVAHEEIVGEL